jgi:chorismate mutase/prephenate dehydratase
MRALLLFALALALLAAATAPASARHRPAPAQRTLSEYRQQIDTIDDKLLALMNERAAVAEKVAVIKKQHGLPVRIPQREEEVIKRLQGLNPGPLPAESVRRIWERIMEEMRALESTQTPPKSP